MRGRTIHRRSFVKALGVSNLGLSLAARSSAARSSQAVSGCRTAAQNLKITKVRAVALEGLDHRFVRVYTDQGITGTGEMAGTAGAVSMINEYLGPSIAGRNPLDIEAIYSHFWSWGEIPGAIRSTFIRGMGGPYLNAVSAIEMALWDIAGKALNVPLVRLFGGPVREKLPIYFWWRGEDTARELIQEKGAKAFKMTIDKVTEASDHAWKLDPSKQSGWTITNREIDAIVENVAAVRAAVGPDVELALECHGRYNTESAIQIGRAVAPSRPLFMEEPIPPDNPEALLRVRNSIPIPVAVGENHYTRYGFREVIEKQAAAVLQPDMSKCGGLLETKKIASMAEIYHIPIAPHGTASHLGQMAYAHVCAAVPNFMILEWGFLFDGTGVNAVMRNSPIYEDGYVHLPDAPGIGIEVDDEAIRARLRPGYEWE